MLLLTTILNFISMILRSEDGEYGWAIVHGVITLAFAIIMVQRGSI